MTREFCPKCQAVKNLIASVSFMVTKDKKGKEKRKIIRAYHCESCNSFIRNEG